MYSINSDSISRIRLGRAQASMFYAARGTTVVAMQGNILVSEGGLAADTSFVVSDGECHVVQRSGWIRLQASGIGPGTAIVSIGLPAAPWWQRWWQRAHTLVALKG
ncbi:hypothetical protein [Collimonas sp.]|jgi:hypothetical protein|uniref:hypothetical protein n=1 Tax=Collimonas sp. TaxID=1963772 RepID=UPI002CD34C70|nr:hypothetical protein [Collimonas sp.]HWW04485.1 hypothetical protein [Collimonas sp.]